MERFHRLDLEGLCTVDVYRLINTQRILYHVNLILCGGREE